MSSVEAIKVAVAKAREGVVYTPKTGALCPLCGHRCKVVSSPKWSGEFKIRYHQCTNPQCVLASTGRCVKSVQRNSAS